MRRAARVLAHEATRASSAAFDRSHRIVLEGPAASAEARAGKATQIVEQLVLEPAVTDGGMRLDPALVIPVAARGARVGIVAGGKPLLRKVPESQIVGRTWSTHPRRHPARVHGVAEHFRPYPSDGKGERGEEQLAVGVGPVPVPAAPVDAGQAGPSAAVLTAAEVDQALRAIDERSEEVRSDDVDRQDLRL